MAGRSASSGGRLLEREFFSQPPDVPVLPETLLCLELNCGGSSIDLVQVSQALLNDMGAALQIFRLAPRERVATLGRPSRIEDCVSLLGIETCIDAISEQIMPRNSSKAAIVDAWGHARAIAEGCAQWAEMNNEMIAPGDAYLVGLFHELGSLPSLLGWDTTIWGKSDLRTLGFRIANQCSLPRCVVEYFSTPKLAGSPNRWTPIVEMAHEFETPTLMRRGPEQSSARA